MIRTYDPKYRGDCRSERSEQIDCMTWLAKHYPERFPLVFHCPNETRGNAQHMQMRAKEGVKAGVPDIIDMTGPIIGLFELKRLDGSKSRISKDQKEFLRRAGGSGHFVAVCYGFYAFTEAYRDFMKFNGERSIVLT